jgi:cytochrome c peroxidase
VPWSSELIQKCMLQGEGIMTKWKKWLWVSGFATLCATVVLTKPVKADEANQSWKFISNPEFYNFVTPKNDPITPEKIELGDRLFNDKRLSLNSKVSCATCHDPARAFTDGRPVAVGVAKGQRNSPTVMNAMFSTTQFWDGRAPSLEEQAKLPITNPVEMGLKDGNEVEEKIRAIPEYKALFTKAFGDDKITFDRFAQAVATFERTKVSTPSPFDRYLRGDDQAITEQAKRGWTVFNGQGRCVSCHGMSPTGAFFTDNKFHNIGVAAHKTNFVDLAKKGLATIETGNLKQIDELAIEVPGFTELGRFLVTKSAGDIGGFKTPTLRNIMVTGPYMHDGSMATLWDVIDHYNHGGTVNPYLDGGMTRLALSENQIDDLVAFLGTLTSPEYEALARKEFAHQRALSRTHRPERNTPLAMGKSGDASDAVQAQNEKDSARLGGRPIGQ